MVATNAAQLHDPERVRFDKKLRNFLDDHSLTEAPTLVLQCAPTKTSIVDIQAKELRNTLSSGTGLNSQDWWDGFGGGYGCVAVFDGLASGRPSQEQRWVTEIHEDGHILAALRADEDSDKPRVYTFLLAAFIDFARLVQRLHASAGIAGGVKLTATIVNGKGLPLINNRTYVQTRARVITREVLEWPVLAAEGPEAIAEVCQQMSRRFERLFP